MPKDENIPEQTEKLPPATRVVAGDVGDDKNRPQLDEILAEGGVLAAILAEGAFPETDPDATVIPSEAFSADSGVTPRKIGPFRLVEEIGAGGFGMVYRAEQDVPVARTVALKIIKPGMDSREIIARFEAERQTLALMEHPNIATVLDAGTTDNGRLYFVMEMVNGIPITNYCDRNRRNTKQRLELFLQVCSAIQHAHQKGIIHRDIKPSNILIATADDKPIVKVIDFGIAKALEQGGGERTEFTLQGQIVGTPQYMSPEQADDTSVDIDTRSDIYSLGVLLYELLTGATPIDPQELRRAGFGGMQRLIREGQFRKPSTRITTTAIDKDSTILKTRGEAPQRVAQFLRGDLDWIVMKALEKSRDRRYDTARGFARDIECFLLDQPVSASPPTAFYLLGKFAARHRGLIVALTAIAVSLVLGTVGMALLYFDAETSRESAVQSLGIANTERTRAEQAESAAQLARSHAEAEAEHKRRLLYSSDMQLASQHWANPDGPADTVAGLLTAHVPGPGEEDLREFAWRHQWHALNQGSATTVVEDGLLAAVALDNGVLLTLNRQMLVRRWSGNRSQPQSELDLGVGWQAGDLSGMTPNGRRVVQVRGANVRVFDTTTGEQVREFSGPERSQRIQISVDSGFLGIVNAETKRLRIWNLETGQPEVLLSRLRLANPIFPLAIASGGKYVLGGNFAGNGVVTLVQPGRGVRRLPSAHDWSVRSLGWAADGQRLASGDGSGMVILRSRDSTDEVMQSKAHSSHISKLCYSTDGTMLASASVEGDLCVMDTTTGTEIKRFKGHTADILSLDFSDDGRFLASASRDGTARLWDMAAEAGRSQLRIRYVGARIEQVEDRREVYFTGFANLETNELEILSGEIAPGDRILSIKIGDRSQQQLAELPVAGVRSLLLGAPEVINTLEVTSPDRDGPSWLVRFRYQREAMGSRRMTFSADGRWLAAAVGKRILVWDWTGDRPTWRLPGDGNAMAISHDSRLLAVNDVSEKSVQLWDLEQRRQLDSWGWSPVGALAFSRDGRFLAASQGHHLLWSHRSISTNQTRIFGLVNRRHKFVEGHKTWVSGVAFSPDNRRLATAGQDGVLKTFETSDWKTMSESAPVNERLACLAYSPDGGLVVAGGWSGSIYLWDADSAELLDTLVGHSSIVTSLDFSPDGRTLATSSSDRTVKLWDVRTRQLLRTLRGHKNVVLGVAFSRNDELVSGALLGEAFVWKAADLGKVDDHPLTLNSLNNLALTHLRRGPFERAETLFRKIADQRRRLLGAEHPLTLQAVTRLGHALCQQEQWADAMTVWESNLTTHVTAFGPDDPRSQALLNELSNLYSNRVTQTFESAHPICERAIDSLNGILGPDDPHIVPFLTLAAISLRKTGDHPAAVSAAERALEAAQKNQPDNHFQLAAIRHELGIALLGRGESVRAEKELREAIQARRDHPEDPSQLGVSLSALVQTLIDRKTEAADTDAMKLCREAVRPPVDQDLKETIYRQLGTLYERRGNFALAHTWNAHAEIAGGRLEASIPLYAAALELQRASLGEDDKVTMDTRNRLASHARRVGNAAGVIGDMSKAAKYLKLSRGVKSLGSYFDLKLAAALHQLGDRDGLRNLLREMLEQYGRARKPNPREQTAKCILALMPEPELLEKAVPMARATYQQKPDLIWGGIGCSLADIRVGEFRTAEDRLLKLEPSPVHLEQRAMILVGRALARQ